MSHLTGEVRSSRAEGRITPERSSCRWGSTRRRTSFRRSTGCVSASPAPISRASGRRRRACGFGSSSLVLPIVPPALERTPRVPRPRQDSSRRGWAVGGAPHLRVTEDLVKKRVSVTAGGWEELELPDGGSLRIRHSGTAAVARARPAGAVVVASAQIDLHLPRGESVVVEARARVRRNRVAYSGRVRMDGELVLDRAWHSS